MASQRLIGPFYGPLQDTGRTTGLVVHPSVVKRLHDLLKFNPEMDRVTATEFLNRACTLAEQQIKERREALGGPGE